MKKSLLLALLCIIALIGGGCIDSQVHLSLHLDQSADLDAVITMKDSLRSVLSDHDPMLEIKNNARAKGYTVTDYTNGDASGVRLQKHLATLADFDHFLIPAAAPATAPGAKQQPSSANLKVERHLFFTRLNYRTRFDLSAYNSESSDVADISQRFLASAVQCRFLLTLPVKADFSNADVISADGKNLEWNLKAGQSNPIQVTVTLPNYLNMILSGVCGGIFLFALVVILWKRKPKITGESS